MRILRRLVLATAALAAVHTVVRAQTSASDTVMEPRSGRLFPVSLVPPGATAPQWIMGTGLRDRTIFRVQIYAFGLYVDPKGARAALSSYTGRRPEALESDESFYQRLLDLEFAMSLRLVLTRTVDGSDIAEAFDDALRPRMAEALQRPGSEAIRAALETFAGYLAVDEVRDGAAIIISCTPDGSLTASVDGDGRPAIDSFPLCRALFDVYLGKDPISESGKRTVVAGFPGLLSQP